MKPVELRRSYEELVEVYRALEQQNQKLRAELERLKSPQRVASPGNKPVDVGHLVDYVDQRGLVNTALVVKRLEGDLLRVKVLRHARADLVLDVPRGAAGQRDCWRRHGEK